MDAAVISQMEDIDDLMKIASFIWIISWIKKGKLGAYAIKRVAAGAKSQNQKKNDCAEPCLVSACEISRKMAQ